MRELKIMDYVEFGSAWNEIVRHKSNKSAFSDQIQLWLESQDNVLWPSDSKTPSFVLAPLLELVSDMGITCLNYSENLIPNEASLIVNQINWKDIWEISPTEFIVSSETHQFAFMSLYETSYTLLMYNGENIGELLKNHPLEYVVCDQNTVLSWK